MKLSVIVPVYNVEKYLPRCLDSLLRQGMEPDEWEVICVNDGSPDNCGAILAEYEQKYPDIFKVITQENKGLGEARNAGMRVAQGEYIGFVDSDDYVVDNSYIYLLENFCLDRPDVLCFGYDMIYTNGKILHNPDASPIGEILFDGDGVDAYNRFPLPFVWAKFYKRSFLEMHRIDFHPVVCEDDVFNFDVFRNHPHIRIVSSKVCRYEQGNEESLLHTANKEKVLKIMDDLFSNIDYFRTNMDDECEMNLAAMRNVNNCLNVFHKKLLMVFLTWGEWSLFHNKMHTLPRYEPVVGSKTLSAQWIGKMRKWSGKSYLLYVFFHFIRKVVFFIFIRRFIVKKETGNTVK